MNDSPLIECPGCGLRLPDPHLALKRGYTGRQVQMIPLKIGRIRRDWSRFEPPARPAGLTVMDVLCAGADVEKEAS